MSRSRTWGTQEVRPSDEGREQRDDERHHREADLALPRPLPPPLTHPFRVSGSTLGPVPQPRPVGVITRGTTNPNRLRRCDRWLAGPQAWRLRRSGPAPVVVDLGYGASPVTAARAARPAAAGTPGRRGGGHRDRPGAGGGGAAARAARGCASRSAGSRCRCPAGPGRCWCGRSTCCGSTTRSQVADAWATDRGAGWPPTACSSTAPATSSGRLATWVAVTADGPVSLSLSWRLRGLERPGVVAERLPKALIHRNVPGEGVHRLLSRPRRGVGAAGTAGARTASGSGSSRRPARCGMPGGRWSTDRHAGGWVS